MKFYLKLAAYLICSIIVIFFIDKWLGPSVASLIGAILGGLILNFLNKNDLKSISIPDIQAQHYEIVFNSLCTFLILYGLNSLTDLCINISKITLGKDYLCNVYTILSLIILDWSRFIIFSYIIFNLYKNNALVYVYVACITYYMQETIGMIAIDKTGGISIDKAKIILECILDSDSNEYDSNELSGFTDGLSFGIYIGCAIRLYISIAITKILLRRKVFIDN